MSIPSKTIAVVSMLMLLCSGTQAAKLEREIGIAVPTNCVGGRADNTCVTLAQQGEIFCIAADRCGTAAPRPVSALIRYDAKMDQLRRVFRWREVEIAPGPVQTSNSNIVTSESTSR